MEKLLEMRKASLEQKSLHTNQHAYQSGKSCDITLHQLVSPVKASINIKKMALMRFLDIEETFDNASSASMVSEVQNIILK